jgi:hypothetical protein
MATILRAGRASDARRLNLATTYGGAQGDWTRPVMPWLALDLQILDAP